MELNPKETFGLAVVKAEGQPVKMDTMDFGPVDPNQPETVYIERCVPKEMETVINQLIDSMLLSSRIPASWKPNGTYTKKN